MSVSGPAALTLLTREGCELCEHMLRMLQGWLAIHQPAGQVSLRDVDADPELARRYAMRVPVLLLDGQTVCEGHFDATELQRLLRPR
jgi:glutaredoxin